MRTSELTVAVAPGASAVPLGAPWPVVLVIGLSGPLVVVLLAILRHRENMTAIRKAPGAHVANVMRWIRNRPRAQVKDDTS